MKLKTNCRQMGLQLWLQFLLQFLLHEIAATIVVTVLSVAMLMESVDKLLVQLHLLILWRMQPKLQSFLL